MILILYNNYAALGTSVTSNLTLIPTNGCGCYGKTLTYECTIMGGPGGATVWTGSALGDCASEEIVLFHRRFTEPHGTVRSCINGAATAQSINVHNNLKIYTSRLNITVTNNVAGATIMCIYDAMGDPNTANITTQLSTKLPCKHVYTVALIGNFHWCKIS